MDSLYQIDMINQSKKMDEFINYTLNKLQIERNKLKEEIEKLESKLQNAIRKLPTKPKESHDQLVEILNKLDSNHTTTSQTKADENKFMQERKKILIKQKQVIEYNDAQSEINRMKSSLSSYRNEIKTKDKNIDDLKVNQRKVSIAIKLKCPMEDIIEDKIKIPSDKVSQIIGKKFANLKKIEDETLVSIKTEKTVDGDSVTIVGNPNSIQKAKAVIMNIVNSAIEDISPPEETIVCLLFNKAALVDEIQRKCNVRIDISRARNLCKISGTFDCIEAAKREINMIDCARSIINIAPSIIPFILGKSGSTIKGLGEGKIVRIDIFKEDNYILIQGLRSHVEVVTSTLHDIISENKEVEDSIFMPKFIILGACSGANTSRNLAKELGVSILLDDKNGSITIRGVPSKVFRAKHHLSNLLSSYQKNTLSIKVDEQFLAWIVGKGGKNINELRKKYQSAHIDILDSHIHINSSSSDTQKEILDYINNVIDSKYSKEIPFDADLSITLKSQKGASIRKKILDDLKIIIDIDTDNQVLKLRGIKANVDIAIAELGEFAKKYHTEVLSISESDIVALRDGGDDSIIKKVAADCFVELNINRKEGLLKVRGVKEAVDKAKSTIIGILEGDSNHGSTLIHCISTALFSLIGKDGKNLKKLESDNGVKIDVLRSENKIRLRGPPECISNATVAISQFIDELKVLVTVNIDSYKKNFNMIELTEEISTLYDVEVIQNNNEITLKGLAYVVEEAKKFIQNKTALTIDYTLPLKSHQMTSLRNVAIERSFRGIMDRNNVVVSIDEMKMLLLIKGPGSNVHISKYEAVKVLSSVFPSEFLLMELELSCLKYVASPKAVMDIEDVTGTTLFIDRSHGCLCIIGDKNSVLNAAQKIKDNQKYWEKLHATFDIDEFMLPSIVGKQGTNIIALQKETETTININRKLMQLEVIATSIDKMIKAKFLIQSKIDKLRKEHWEHEIPSSILKLFIGKQGANINKMREESGANIDITDKSTIVKVTGNESSVLLAKDMVLSFVEKESQKNFQTDLHIPHDAIGLILGTKGTRIKEIHDDSGAKIEIDKVRDVVIIKGTPESCSKAEIMINKILDDNGFNEPEPAVNENEEEDNDDDEILDNEPKSSDDVIITGKFGRLPPGATPAMIAKLQEQSLSKSALRRKRRKEKQWQEEAQNIDLNASQFEYNEIYTSSSKDEISCKNENALSLSALVQKSDNEFSSLLIPGPIVTNFNFGDKSSGGSSNNTSPKNGVGIIGSPRATTSNILGTMNYNTMNNLSTDLSALGNVSVSSILDYHSKDIDFTSHPPGLPQPSFMSIPINNNTSSNYNINDSSKVSSSTSSSTTTTTETTNDGYFKSKAGFSIRL